MSSPVVLSTHSANAHRYMKAGQPHPFDHNGQPVYVDDSLPREGLYEGLHPSWLRHHTLFTIRAAMKLIGADLGTDATQAQVDEWNAKLEPVVKATGVLEFFRILPKGQGRGDAEYLFRFSLPHPRRIDIARQPERAPAIPIYEDGI